jgi:drug/metabolite transporter (DMT)-like permease
MVRVQAGTIVALILALASTILVSLAYLREHGAVAGMLPLSLRRPLRSLRLLLRSRAWMLGFAMETSGFLLYVAALALAPLALVQSVAAGGIGILAVASWRLGGRRLSGREVTGAALAVAGLVLLAVSLAGGAGSGAHGSLGAIALWLGATVVVAVLVLTSGRALFGRGVGDGIAGGLFFASGDICTKLATAGGTRFLFVLLLIPAYVLGTSLLQIGYQSAAALTVAGIATLLTNALPIAAGTVLLHEPLPNGALGVVRVLAFATVTAGAILLAKPERHGAREPAHASSS